MREWQRTVRRGVETAAGWACSVHGRGALFSLGAHVAAGLALGWVAWSGVDRVDVEPLLVRQLESVAEKPVLEMLPANPVAMDAGSSGEGASVNRSLVEVVPIREPTESVATDAPESLLADAPSGSALLAGVKPGGAGFGRSGKRGRGTGEGDGTGAGKGTGFFGVEAKSGRVVYVVDCSGSMNAPTREGNTRFQRLQLELVRSISGLEPGQAFYVVFFNSEAFPMPSKTLENATDENKKLFLGWVGRARASGNTDPEGALGIALRLKPETIYLLTDGDFDPRISREVTAANRSVGAAIHTIGFAAGAAGRLLERIAEGNAGTYTFVP